MIRRESHIMQSPEHLTGEEFFGEEDPSIDHEALEESKVESEKGWEKEWLLELGLEPDLIRECLAPVDDLTFVKRHIEKKQQKGEKPASIKIEGGKFNSYIALITISGLGSVGNTSTADYTAEELGFPKSQVFHAGEVFRRYKDSESGSFLAHDTVNFIERPEILDLLVDRIVMVKILDASVDNPTIIEAKFAAVMLRFLERHEKELGIKLPVPRIAGLKWADSKKRTEIASKKKGTTGMSAQEIRRLSRERYEQDVERATKVHPWMEGYSNILDPNYAKDDKGDPLYQIILDASKHSGPEEDFEDLHYQLSRTGWVSLEPDRPVWIN